MGTGIYHKTDFSGPLVLTPFGRKRTDEALRELSQALVEGYSMSQLLDEAIRLVSLSVDAPRCAIFQLSNQGLLCRGSSYGLNDCVVENVLRFFNTDLRKSAVLRTESPIVLDCGGEPGLPGLSVFPDDGTPKALVVPIAAPCCLFGIVTIFAPESRQFTTDETCFLQSLAGLLAVAWDRDRTEEALREGEQRFRLMVEGSEQVFFYAHDNKFIVQYASPSMFNVLGYRPEEVVGHHGAEFFEEDPTNETALALTHAALQDGVRQRPYITVLRHKDGRRVLLETLETPIVKDGVIVGIQGFARDVTARVDSERSLLERTAYLKALVEHSPLGIVVLDPEHRVKMCNPAFESLFQHRQAEIVGTKLDNKISPAGMVAEATNVTQRAMSGEAVHRSTRRKRKDGTLIDVELHGVPLIVDGEQIGVFAIYQDITERKHAEESLRNLSAKLLQLQDEERRRIARELHDSTAQILAALTMNLGALSQEAARKLDNSANRIISESLGLAEQCAREVRTLSYLLHPPLLDESGLSDAVQWYAQGFSQRSGIEVSVEIPSGLGRLARELELALFRIVQESLTNVHRHSGSTRAKIRIRTANNLLTLEVIDNGRGLSRSKLSPGRGGLGVGLAGMRERAQQLGGHLELSSRKGTTVRAILPLRPTA